MNTMMMNYDSEGYHYVDLRVGLVLVSFSRLPVGGTAVPKQVGVNICQECFKFSNYNNLLKAFAL
jgi:hypothetical protein